MVFGDAVDGGFRPRRSQNYAGPAGGTRPSTYARRATTDRATSSSLLAGYRQPTSRNASPLSKYQRYGIENGQAITNAYLPSTAAPNLSLATWMNMQDSSAANTEVEAVPTEVSASNAKTLTNDQKLEIPIDVVFDQQSLENAMNSIIDEINARFQKANPSLVPRSTARPSKVAV